MAKFDFRKANLGSAKNDVVQTVQLRAAGANGKVKTIAAFKLVGKTAALASTEAQFAKAIREQDDDITVVHASEDACGGKLRKPGCKVVTDQEDLIEQLGGFLNADDEVDEAPPKKEPAPADRTVNGAPAKAPAGK